MLPCCWWRKTLLLCRTSERVHFLFCYFLFFPFLFLFFCWDTLIGSYFQALLKHFVAPHRPGAEITCRPLKVKYQQVLSLIKALRMSRVFFFYTLAVVALKWDLAANQEVSAQRLFKVMLGSRRFEIASVCGWLALYAETHRVWTLCERWLKACMWPVSIKTLSHTVRV